MADNEDYGLDAPEEFTQEQAILEDEEIRKAQNENKARINRERKKRHRQWAERITPRSSVKSESVEDVEEEPEETPEKSLENKGMLPSNIVELLAAREKQVFSSDSDDEEVEAKSLTEKKGQKSSGKETVMLKEIPPPECMKKSMEFLKKRKMQVRRSSSVLGNANQSLRLASSMLNNKL